MTHIKGSILSACAFIGLNPSYLVIGTLEIGQVVVWGRSKECPCATMEKGS